MSGGDLPGLEAANTVFYDSFEALDLDAMMGVWDDWEEVYCVHPGAEVIIGWGPVRRSWAAIFASTSYLQFIVTDVRGACNGGFGRITCTENILSSHGGHGHLGGSRAVATNLFVWRDGRWRMTGHHASPVLRTGPQPEEP